MARLTKIYTRTGDTGETGLVGGHRVSKDSTRVWAYGTVDELNSVLGLARAFNAGANQKLDTILAGIQNDLFNLGAELATPAEMMGEGMPRAEARHLRQLEQWMDEWNAELGALKEFILPGGTKTAAALHMARTVCRRAERYCVRLAKEEAIGDFVVPYLNRLSDALFVFARLANAVADQSEIYWKK